MLTLWVPGLWTVLCVFLDPLVRPEFLLLLLEQGDRSLEDHTRLFLLLANATSYPDDCALLLLWCKCRRPKMVLKRILPPSWSGFWRETDRPSPSATWMISPDPLPTQSPAHLLPTVRSISPSPPMMESLVSAKLSDWVEDRPGSWAQPVWPGARSGDSGHHEGASRGRCERGMELRPLHRSWGWADYTAGTAGPRGGSDWLGYGSGGSRSWVYPWKPGGWQMPALPPAPASSTAVVWQPLCSPSAHHQYGVSAAGLPPSIVAVAGESLTSASSLRGPDSASVRRPSSSTSAPSSLASTGLPRPSGSALVGCRPAIATGSVELLPPASSTLVLSRSGSAADLRISASVARAPGSTLAPRILGISLARWVSASGSSSTCSATVGRPPGVSGHSSSMAPPCPPSSPPWSLSVGPLPGVRPPPEPPPKLPLVPPSVVSMARRRGAKCQNCGLSCVCVFFSPCAPWPSFCLLFIMSFGSGVCSH